MSRCRVKNVFLRPTALKMLRLIDKPRDRWRLSIRSIASGRESLGGQLHRRGRDSLGVAIKFYGPTELGTHQYPRRVVLLTELAMTATGKIMRQQLWTMA